MHLLLATPGAALDDGVAVDLGQSPADIVVLSAADSEIALIAAAHAALRARHGVAMPGLRAANWLKLKHNASVDAFVERVVLGARLVIVRLLGGRGYWPYGVDQIAAACRANGIALALLPGDDKPDADLAERSTLAPEDLARAHRCFVEGGQANAESLLALAATRIGARLPWREPESLPVAGIHRAIMRGRPLAALLFYRALHQAGDLAPVDALIEALDASGLDVRAIFVSSLKAEAAQSFLRAAFAESAPEVIVNLTGFAVGDDDPLAAFDCPVLQAVIASGDVEAWRAGTRGLAPRDIAMSVALPELDGRIMSRAIAFKGLRRRDEAIEADLVAAMPEPSRIAFVADLAAAWARLRRAPQSERRVALVLANYPNRDGRIANGVGLDTPASVVAILDALARSGHRLAEAPSDGDTLMRRLVAGPTNAALRAGGETLSLAEYQIFLSRLAPEIRARVAERWGPPESDPSYEPGALDCGRFRLPILALGNVVIAIQPARGYQINPASSYHDPDLPPPHGYLAVYAWLRESFGAHAIMHVGKHGNLEWLPGKSIALSRACFSEAALGPLPHLYPFIVNDPGEGTQAKRRASAVIIDHLTPPLARAESHGTAAALERLIDEYYEAAQQDPRRCTPLAREILAHAAASGIDRDCGIAAETRLDEALVRLDGFLCELKERQIRDGLHVFGRAPEASLRDSLLVAIARQPRGDAPADESLLRALAADLALAADPLTLEPAASWHGPWPDVLGARDGWRSAGDTVERLESLAADLVARRRPPRADWARTRAVLAWIDSRLAPAVAACGEREIAGLLAGLAGRRVAPGPSGAPTRGRSDVLPTGRNFYSVDTRAVPTPSAWTLGWAAANALLERHLQDEGEPLRRIVLTAWGTSNMRTGGDDIAQALALIGARPTWDPTSKRVVGFEILPLTLLDRPRVDVTLRVSGLFRDAFAGLIELFDRATRAIAALDEPNELNALRERPGARVFGPKPGAYGAGLQALIDEGGWSGRGDLARAYVAWGGYAYASGEGAAAHGEFESRLACAQAIVQAQDNREHDVLDSDDYYQFEGGGAAAIETLSGRAPTIYHLDTALPERPRVLTLAEEIARVVRARATNPKWIAGCKRHGYKGAFEIAATVDYLFAFAATTNAVRDHHFDAVFSAYLEDPDTRAFIARANPAALREIAARLLDAQDRSLWRPRLNSTRALLERLNAGAAADRGGEGA